MDVGGNSNNYTQTGGKVTAIGHNSPGLGGATGGMRMSSGSTDPHGGSVLGKILVSGGTLTATNSFSGAVPAIAPAIGGECSRDRPLKRSVYGCYSGVIVSYTLIPVLGKFVLAF